MEKNGTDISIKKAISINFIGKYSSVLIQIIYGAILSRILTPEDFGVVAVVTVFTSFFTLIANMGIGPALIQNQTIEEDDITNIFSLTIYVGLAISILFTIFSIPLSFFYDNVVYIPIGILLSISLFFNTINIVPNALLLKSHKFKLINIRLVVVTILAAIPTIVLAIIGFKYYAIVIHSILVSVFTFLWNYVTIKPKVTFRLKKKSINKIKEFSSYQLAFSVVNYFSRNSDNLLIGKFIGASALGFYDKSYRLMLYPTQNLTHVITPVLHPILSTHQNDKDYIYEKYLKVFKILSLLGIFATVYSYFSAEEIIVLLYGNQWVDSIDSFRFLALSIWAQMVTSSTGAIFQSLGDTKMLFRTGLLSSFLIVSAIIVGISLGSINTVSISIALAYNLNFFVSFYFLISKSLEQSINEFIKNLMPDLVIFIVTFSGMFIVSQISFNNLFLSASIKFVFGFLFYFLAMILTKQTKYIKSIMIKSR